MNQNSSHLTLRQLIPEAFLHGEGHSRFGKNKEKWIEEAKKLSEWFENCYGHESSKHTSCLLKADPLDLTLEDIVNDMESFIENIRLGIKVLMKDKYYQAIKVEFFIKYLNKHYYTDIDMTFLDPLKCRNKEDRLLKLLKYMHSEGKSRDEIAESFGIDKRVLDDDLSTLIDGFEFMGTEMKIRDLTRGQNTYKSPIHPIFLSMDSAEIYALTLGLKLLSKGTIFEHTLSRVADQVHQQLSDYALKMVDGHSELENVLYEMEQLRFMGSNEMAALHDSPYCLYLKDSKTCIIYYDEDGESKTITGKLSLVGDSPDRFKKIKVSNLNEERTINVKDIRRITGE